MSIQQSNPPSGWRERVSRQIESALSRIHEPGSVFEIRALGVTAKNGSRFTSTLFGYFDNAASAASAVVVELETSAATGWYFTLNPCVPALLARSANRLRRADKGDGTKDHEIERRYWLPIDFDPIRPSGISSTNAEHEEALELARRVRRALTETGWPKPILADSGNGAHLLFPLDLPNDAVSTDFVRRTLEGLARDFDTERVKIDRNVFNAARIWKLPGTRARKGDSTEDRPHRWAYVIGGEE